MNASGDKAARAAGRLSLGTKLGFGVCDLGGNLFFTAMGFWSLSFLTDTVRIPAAAAGLAVMIGKLWDAVTDPMMGFISDRTRSRWGRRRPYLLFGAIPLFLSMWFFFTNPHIGSPVLTVVWAALALCLLNTAYTVVNIPYNSLTPELTSDYHERSSLNGFRFGFASIGTFLGVGVVLPIVSAFGSRDAGFSAVGALFGVLMAVTALITFVSVREPDHSNEPRPKEGFFATYLVVFKNPHYVRILLTYALHITALGFLQIIIVYYFKYLYRNEAMTTLAMVILLAVAMIFIPISVAASKPIGKKKTYQISFAIFAFSCMALFFLGHVLGMYFFFGMMLIAGIGLGFSYVAPFAMVPDTVEFDAVTTGKRKEGAFYGMWTFMSKVGSSLALGISGLVLGLSKFIEPSAANALPAQPDSALLAIRLIIGPIPAAIFIGAIVFVEFYKLDEKAYAAVLEAAEAKKA